MEVLNTAEVVVGACLAVAVLTLIFIAVRRRLLARGGDLLLCSVRTDDKPRWRAGLLRFDDTRLSWMPLLGIWLSATYAWDREGLELGGIRQLEADQSLDPTAVRTALSGRAHGSTPTEAELGLGQESYTALRSWVEAGPPRRLPVDW
ncbi:hypothetical protein KEM60_00759 [Austwickia sp. TVS 96-490-7B]|uniref:DUF2550 family protein n=1 Tax=Austwickia sp. TVS 96-490-7B TaxID=2830843 RepID=UPI001C59F92C|nr:DUF2550 family protein [Austwickia sp. TVS 96-490-7B]MBW3084571.1 hypothetical protein [Austwickia sp. TVS 96-490-7B]